MMTELLAKMEAYADGRLDRVEFDIRLYELSFDVEAKYPEAIVAVVHEVEGLLAEASSAGWSEESLRGELKAVVESARGARALVA